MSWNIRRKRLREDHPRTRSALRFCIELEALAHGLLDQEERLLPCGQLEQTRLEAFRTHTWEIEQSILVQADKAGHTDKDCYPAFIHRFLE